MISSYFSPKPKATGGDRPKRGRAVTAGSHEDGGGGDAPPNKRPKSEPRRGGAPAPAPARPARPACEEARDLLSHLSDGGASGDEEVAGRPTWMGELIRHASGPGFASLARFVASERAKGKTVYPPPEDVFSALNLTPLNRVKVVVVGQDPYHGPGQGHGLAFSVRRGVAVPPSLRNMYRELLDDPDVPEFDRMPDHGHLERWARQGVLLLNSVLTVRRGEANSHKGRGWEKFTDEVVRVLHRNGNGGNGGRGLVFLLWGRPASKKAEGVLGGVGKDGRHAVICTSHPSPLGAAKTASPFLGSRCFSRANAALRERGLDPIDWNVDGPLDDSPRDV